MSLESLEGRVCVLTGATGGIGQALAAVLAAQGAKLILAGRDARSLAALDARLPTGSVIEIMQGDLTRDDARRALAERAAQQTADTLINLCGQNDVSLFEFQRAETIESMLAANLHTPLQLTRRMLPAMKHLRRPLIVNVGSVFGQIGYPGYAAYCATKFGLRGFSEALRRELDDSTVRVVHVEPRATRTGMNRGVGDRLNEALGNRVDPPEVVARCIARAMATARPSTVIGMPERLYARINAFLPSVIDRSLASRLGILKKVLQATPDSQGGQHV